jgi:predicted TIM-barrel fold metal-dependent hydrolase
MSTTALKETGAVDISKEMLISSDSHIIEPADLWEKQMPASQRDQVPKFSDDGGGNKPGGTDPKERVKEMAQDGVSAEVLYPTRGLRLFAIEDPDAQEAAFRIGNDWMAEYCAAAPDRLWGIPMISCYNIPPAIKELERCKKLGLKGALIWQVPPEHLRFTTDHYDDLWAAAQDLDMPVNLHILSGFNYSRFSGSGTIGPVDAYRNSVNTKLNDAVTSVFDLVFTGAMDRFPRLKFVLVENEVGWIAFVTHQWDRYVRRFGPKRPIPISELPSFYVNRQVYSTFIDDLPGGAVIPVWGEDNCMWSNDYPHAASTWPNSKTVIDHTLGHLAPEIFSKVVRGNVTKLYNLPAVTRL